MFNPQLSLRAEDQLILACVHSHPTSIRKARIQELAAQVTDWSYLTQVATVHGVFSLVANNLNALCSEQMPPAVLEILRSRRALFRAQTLVKITALVKVLRVLQDNGITAMPLKGAMLAGLVYGNSLLRDFTDIDVFVQRSDVPRAIALLKQLNYHAVDERLAFQQDGLFRWLTRYSQLYQRDLKKGFIQLDLHWGVMPPFLAIHLNHRDLWARASQHSLFGTTVLALSPEDLVLLLCMHGSKHAWADLKVVVDLAQALRTYPSLDWSLLDSYMRTAHVERMVAIGLYMVSWLLDSDISESACRLMERNPAGRALAMRMVERYDDAQFGQGTHAINARLFISLPEHRIDKLVIYIALLGRITPNDNDRAFVALPGHLGFLYYVLRPIRLLKDFGTGFVKAIFK